MPRTPAPDDARKELAAFAREYRKREERLTADLDRLREERDRRMREAKRAGMSNVEIGALFGLSHQRVAQIVG